ncbi:hypothetical protein HMPREF9336_02813 [Segniliparus rugosus ATCC BAA-974]|uniref:Uncharacterized protein n=2 Tax=Segniliparus rugosus TaxID=286804 RepID=E5XTJ1_SEGRC|nr:hypothetical protein HMPREF9336_02813 [Segniliparus rugosus ATCC BAA-974]
MVWGALLVPPLGVCAVVVAFLSRTCAEAHEPIIDLALPFVMFGVLVAAAFLGYLAYLAVCLIPARGTPALGFAAAVLVAASVARSMALLGLGSSLSDAARCTAWMPWW